jgi:hypothetical protein
VILVTAAGFGVSELHLEIPTWGAWFFDLRFALDPGVQTGGVMAVVCGNTTFSTEVLGVSSEGNRFRVQAVPVGTSIMRQNVDVPRFLPVVGGNVLASLLSNQTPIGGQSLNFKNVVIPSSITKWQALTHFFPTLWFDPQAMMHLDPPSPKVRSFSMADYTTLTQLLELNVQDSFELWPGDVVNGYTIGPVVYSFSGGSMRAICEVTNAP